MSKYNSVKLAFFGDVIGKPGRRLLLEKIPELKEENQLDLIIANGENSAGGRGVNEKSVIELYESGIDVVTLGDHTFYESSFDSFLDKSSKCIRPLNYPNKPAGNGYLIIEVNSFKVAICNLIGRVSMGLLVDCPYKAFDKFEAEVGDVDIKIVDFHAEATSEKNAMAHYIGERGSLLVGTHTHVQTADERIFNCGLGYITDLGMCGPYDSVIGMDKDVAMYRLTTSRNKHYKIAKGRAMLNGIIAEIAGESSKTLSIKRVNILEEV